MNKAGCWILGTLTGIVVAVGAEAIVLAAVPTKTYLNGFGTTIVGEELGSKGLFSVLANVNSIKVDDLPIIKDTLDKLTAEGGLGDLVQFDYNAIKDLRLSDPNLSNALKNAIQVTATLKSLNVDLGDFGQLKMFKQWTPAAPSNEEIAASPKVFYYKDGNNAYQRAFDDHGQAVAGYTSGSQLYLADLSSIVVDQLFANLSYQIKGLSFKEFLTSFMGVNEADLSDNTLYKIIGDRPLSELSDLTADDILLKDVIGGEAGSSWVDTLSSLLDTPYDQIKVSQLSGIDFSTLKLTAVLKDNASNAKLYGILMDLTGYSVISGKTHDDIHIGDLEGLDVGNIRLSSVLSLPEDPEERKAMNVILRTLLEKDVKVGELGDSINGLTLYELFGADCFTTDEAKKVNADTYRYDEENKIYTYDNAIPGTEETYYVSADAGIWLLFAYDAGAIQGNGRANTFAPSTVTFSSLQNNAGTFSEKISNATIYQLLSAKVVQEDPGAPFSDGLKAMTLSQALATL